MGIRLSGPKLENIVNTNIKSEGLVRGVIQVPADGNPIIMLSDHGTIGGYPKDRCCYFSRLRSSWSIDTWN